ncbi:hypothetical protein Rhe02_66420 [Rhizocola hellebori]|uniref:Tetratricopeptide repeat protein n=1 Tax=Rhizocola hellebori TaxID=1392758 RepID=A0A8J3VJD7_9ACTN|nr:hypothetical protein [Rhizocola hellebori]GIH08575.1 hypothetical protein Rhe02_66420 [Rhizocola hellebori]
MPLQRRAGVAVLTRAREHVDAGEFAAALELLSELLSGLPTDPRRARPVEAESVALQTGVLLSLGEPYAARGWAAYGHAAFRRLYGERDRRTLHALGLLGAVLTRVGAHGRAAKQYQTLIGIYTELEGAQSEKTLAARADLATVEHARGQCVTARLRLANVVAEHQQAYGSAHPVGVRMLARLAAMWRDCGDFDHAHALLAEARANAAGLGPEIHELLAAAALAPAAERHLCGSDPLPDKPLSPVELTVPRPIEEDTVLVPVIEEAFIRPFSTMSYLPAHPELTEWAPSPRAEQSPQGVALQMSPATMALIAAIVGIVAVAVLLVLLISAARNG